MRILGFRPGWPIIRSMNGRQVLFGLGEDSKLEQLAELVSISLVD